MASCVTRRGLLPACARAAALRRAGLVAFAAALALVALLAPIKLCLMAAVFRVPCPGCGLTRAAIAIARGDLARASALHPLSIVIVPMAAWFAASHALRYVRTGNAWSEARLSRLTEATLAAATLLLVAVWIARFFGYFGGPVSI